MSRRWKWHLASLGVIVTIYLVLRWFFTERQTGLITPDGSLNVGMVAFGAALLVMRVIVLALPALLAAWTTVQLFKWRGGSEE